MTHAERTAAERARNLSDREAVAEILAAGVGPWEPYPGCRTCAEHAENMAWARRWNERLREVKEKKGKVA